MWDGQQSLKGKRILVWSEQGVGDTIMWSSRLSLLASQAKHCILECQPKLIPLLKRSFPNVEVKAEDRSIDQQRDDFDFHLPTGSLYKNFIQDISTTYKADAYLVPDPARVNYWKDRLKSIGKGPYIGISWKSSSVSPSRLNHYPPISEWASILTMPDVTFINLQYVDFAEDLNQIKNDLGVTVHNFDDLDHFNNIDDVAALCTALDMVVSTKTTVPLISTAVGTSTKLANWKQSPWNNVLLNPHGPSIDVFERNTWEPWEDVFKLITKDVLKKTTVNKPENNNPIQHPPQELIDQLINQYNQGQHEAMSEQAKALTEQYPHAFVIWNCLGVANLDLGRIEEASEAFEKVTELNPNYADGYNLSLIHI